MPLTHIIIMSVIEQEDTSRFGRNYLQVGMYAEIMFPDKDVRFIAINDGVDMVDCAAENHICEHALICVQSINRSILSSAVYSLDRSICVTWSRQPGQLSVRAVLRHFAPYKGLVLLAASASAPKRKALWTRAPCAAAAAIPAHFAAEAVRLKTCVEEYKAAWYTYTRLHDIAQ